MCLPPFFLPQTLILCPQTTWGQPPSAVQASEAFRVEQRFSAALPQTGRAALAAEAPQG